MSELTRALDIYPKVGDDIYVKTSWYIDHGEDDFLGGLCEVTEASVEVTAGSTAKLTYCVREQPGSTYYCHSPEAFMGEQAKMKKEYGRRRGRPDPDMRYDEPR